MVDLFIKLNKTERNKNINCNFASYSLKKKINLFILNRLKCTASLYLTKHVQYLIPPKNPSDSVGMWGSASGVLFENILYIIVKGKQCPIF